MTVRHTLPGDAAATRQALYQGDIFHLPATPASTLLGQDVNERLGATLLGQGGDPREAQFRLPPEDFFAAIGALRKELFLSPRYHEALFGVQRSCGFDPGDSAFDPLRLRVIADHGFADPRAAPVYYAHRDTWYAHPQCLLTWWIALHDVSEAETFVFYPDWFTRPVPNSSADFDYDDWVRDGWELKIGWQRRDAGLSAHYPGPTVEPPTEGALPFAARAGDILIFSGAHYHQSRKNRSGRTRFSLDFRSVHLGDEAAGRGAPNVDARARGSALRDYVRPTRGA